MQPSPAGSKETDSIGNATLRVIEWVISPWIKIEGQRHLHYLYFLDHSPTDIARVLLLYAERLKENEADAQT